MATEPDRPNPEEAPPRRRAVGLIVLFSLVGLSFLAAFAVGYLVVLYPEERGTGTGTAAVTIDRTTTLRQLAQALARERAVPHPWTFALYARAMGAEDRLREGRILIMRNMTARELLQRVATGYGSAAVLVTIPEGWTRFEIANRLVEWSVADRDAFLSATQDRELLASAGIDARGTSAEGYLFPDTYWLRDSMTPRAIVERMLENGRKRWTTLERNETASIARLRDELGFDRFGIMTLASIVEKEARIPSEQPIIAGVFLNRLRDPKFRPKRLQADPTVAYGCFLLRELPSCARFDGRRITRVMTADPDNPYNTYRLEGLPPGPIGSPGLSAIRAVLRPASHQYFYFVARGDGHHTFTATLESHGEAVQRAAAVRAGAAPVATP